MSGFEVQYVELSNRADQLSEMNTRLKTMINSLSEKEASLNSMWEGEAREQFHTAFMNDHDQMLVFYETVAKYVETLRKIAKTYKEKEMVNFEIAKNRTY